MKVPGWLLFSGIPKSTFLGGIAARRRRQAMAMAMA
jgi:hypothetical protein